MFYSSRRINPHLKRSNRLSRSSQDQTDISGKLPLIRQIDGLPVPTKNTPRDELSPMNRRSANRNVHGSISVKRARVCSQYVKKGDKFEVRQVSLGSTGDL